MDIKCAFPNGYLQEAYVEQPLGLKSQISLFICTNFTKLSIYLSKFQSIVWKTKQIYTWWEF